MNAFFEMINSLQSPFDMIVLVSLISCGMVLIAVVSKEIRKYACYRQELDFKRELIDRGMTPEDVDRVVQAKSKSGPTAV